MIILNFEKVCLKTCILIDVDWLKIIIEIMYLIDVDWLKSLLNHVCCRLWIGCRLIRCCPYVVPMSVPTLFFIICRVSAPYLLLSLCPPCPYLKNWLYISSFSPCFSRLLFRKIFDVLWMGFETGRDIGSCGTTDDEGHIILRLMQKADRDRHKDTRPIEWGAQK